LDGSIRYWDVESKPVGVEQALMQEYVIKATDQRGKKVGINACSFSPEGKFILGGCNDGSVQLWETRTKSHHRP
jgi:WD40 repeat protein